MRKLNHIFALTIISLSCFTSCEKTFDDPTPRVIEEGTVATIAEVRAMEVSGTEVRITEDISVYGVVTMDESTGNLYKESYITDATGNLYLRFISSSGLYIGDSVMVNLKGAKILRYNQMLQIDSLHPDNNIVKLATQQFKTPEVTTIDALLNNLEAAQGKLIQLDNTWFTEGGQGKTFADAANLEAVSRILQDLNGSIVDVRTSGYANFAGDTIPSGVGSFIGVVAQYNSGLQLLIRNPNELTLNGVLPQMVLKDFNDNSVTSGGWVVKEPIPASTSTLTWSTSTLGGASTPYGIMKNYNGSTNEPVESWLISPAMDFSSSTSPTINLLSDFRYTGAALEVLVSTDYDGVSMPSSATWTPLSIPLDTDGNNWGMISSGNVSLNSYIGNNSVYIGFKYTGSNSDGSTWELEDIQITY